MSRPLALACVLWPADRLGEAIAGVAAAAGVAGRQPVPGVPRLDGDDAGGAEDPGGLPDTEIEIDRVEVPWVDLERALPYLGPAVMQVGEPAAGCLALLGRRGHRVAVLTPGGGRQWLGGGGIAAALRGSAGARHAGAVEDILAELRLSGWRRRRARAALAAARLAASPGAAVHLLGTGGAADGARFPAARLGGPMIGLLAAVAAAQASVLLSWYLLGRGLLEGGVERFWLPAWGLLVVSLPLVRAAELAAAAGLGQRGSLLARRRMLARLLSLSPGDVRGDGVGRFVGRVLAGEALERSLLVGAPEAAVALFELAGATAALARGAAATPQVLLLAMAVAAAGLLFGRHGLAHQACGERRLELTDQLVEDLAGHRTRLVQGMASADAREDARLAAYCVASRWLGRHETLLRTALPRAWLLIGLGVLAPSLAAAGAQPGRLAASLGGLLLGQAALGRLGCALCDLAAARTAARELRPLAAAGAARARSGAGPSATGRARGDGAAQTAGVAARVGAARRLLEARDLVLDLPGRSWPLLAGACLDIRGGDRLLLDGPSGAGKSTLAAMLAAQRPADGGLLLLGGLDRATLGDRAWRRRVVAVPQLHVNHVFAETLAFNLLAGRGWPASDRDLADADALCRELGLGALLERLPAGLDQRVGEGGWQLSDGERSRVYLARALLQECDLLILDECLAALDTESRLEVLGVVARRAKALMLIAHREPRAAAVCEDGR